MKAAKSFTVPGNSKVRARPSIDFCYLWGALILGWCAMVASADVFQLIKDRPTTSCPELCTCPVRKHEGLTANCSGVGNDRKLLLAVLPRLASNLSNLFFTKNKLDLIYFNKTLPGSIKNCLKLIDLSLNDLRSLLPNIFEEYNQLESLFLSKNYLETIAPKSFKGLHSLRLLNLDNNYIRSFQNGAFDGLPQLQDLSATGNALTSLMPEVLYPIPSLQQLYLDNNSLTSLDEDFHSRFQYFTFRNVHFRGNPLHCDCRLTWLAVWYRNQAMEEDKKSPIPTCSWPALSNGKSLITIPLLNFTCSTTKTLYSECQKWNSTLSNNGISTDSDMIKNNESCYGCPRGFYGANVHRLGKLYCQPCSLFETSDPGSTVSSHCRCRSGFYRATNNTCVACPLGTYKPRPGDDSSCLRCTNGSSTHTNGAATCDCNAGYYMERSSCLECAARTYKRYPGPHHSGPYGCFPCSEARTSPRASTSVQQCVCLTGTANDSRNSCSADSSRHHHPASVKQLISHSDESTSSASHVIAYVSGSLVFVAVVLIILRHFLTRKHRKQSIKKLELRAVNSFLPRMAVQDTGYSLPTDGWEIDMRQIALVRVLGEGAFGVVYEAMASGLPGTNEPTIVAVKTLRDECTSEERNALRSELEQLLYVGQHPNIVNLLGCVTSKGCFMLVMEYAQNGDLLSYLKSKKSVLSRDSKQSRSDEEETISDESAALRSKEAASDYEEAKNSYVMQEQLLSFAWQVAKGMNHLAGIKCIHRDLAARNILLADGWIVKITDFGLARAVYESGYYFKQSKGRLPFKWMAPEAILQGQYTVKSDIWSFGVLLWEMVTLGSTPYPGVPINSLLDLLLSGYRMPKPQDCLTPVYELMASCWQEHPSERPTFDILMSKLETLLANVSNRDYLEIPGDDENINTPVTSLRGTSPYENDAGAPWLHADLPNSLETPLDSSRERISSFNNG